MKRTYTLTGSGYSAVSNTDGGGIRIEMDAALTDLKGNAFDIRRYAAVESADGKAMIIPGRVVAVSDATRSVTVEVDEETPPPA